MDKIEMKLTNIQIYYTGWIVSVGNKKKISFFRFFFFPLEVTGGLVSVCQLRVWQGGMVVVK